MTADFTAIKVALRRSKSIMSQKSVLNLFNYSFFILKPYIYIHACKPTSEHDYV